MSDTPRTDAVEQGIDSNDCRAWRSVARQLERELTAARKEIEELRNGIVAEAKRIKQTHVMVPVEKLIAWNEALSESCHSSVDHLRDMLRAAKEGKK